MRYATWVVATVGIDGCQARFGRAVFTRKGVEEAFEAQWIRKWFEEDFTHGLHPVGRRNGAEDEASKRLVIIIGTTTLTKEYHFLHCLDPHSKQSAES